MRKCCDGPGSVNIKINKLKDKLIKIEGINALLQEENQKLNNQELE